MIDACDDCLRRPWLLVVLAGHLERTRSRLDELLELDERELLTALGGRRRTAVERRLTSFDPDAARRRARQAGIEMICRCQPEFPQRLRALPSAPAVIHVAGNVDRVLLDLGSDPVAVVGTRRATGYGLEVARALGRGLASAGVMVVSGMAHGIDSAAHEGALEAGGATVAILAGGPERSYPASRRQLHRRIVASGGVISELPPGTEVFRWMFPARNRLIAGLSAMTIVVEAGERSGALLTAHHAQSLDRPVAAVPGRITTPVATGSNHLLRDGALLITSPQDVLDALYGAGVRSVPDTARAELDPQLRHWLEEIAAGNDTPAALARAGLAPEQALQVLSALELSGHIRRQAGGRFCVVA